MGDIIHNAAGEMIFGCAVLQFLENGLDHRRGKFLAGKPVAPADHAGFSIKRGQPLFASFAQGGDHIDVKWFAHRAGFLGAVEHGDPAHGRGQRTDQSGDGKRTVKAHF